MFSDSSNPQADTGRYGGYTSLTPHIIVSPAREAVDFYCRIFSARLLSRTDVSDRVLRALLGFGQGKLTLSDPFGEADMVTAGEYVKTGYSLAVYVPNVDEAISAALEAGAQLQEPVETFVSGDRYASIIDPFGVRWSVLTRIEDMFRT